ncbi:MAG TPA: hypothetical protein VM032_05925 [Vicinamibacterales bacterium]|nr:hypothetical protein [Vicinamibacterales bacterium]
MDGLMQFSAETWGEPLLAHAWEDFWNYDDVPEDTVATPEFYPMFIPWLVLGFVPDPESEDVGPDWPSQPIGLEWLATISAGVPDLDRLYVETACRSPLSVFAVEQVTPGRSLDIKDVLTGARFHVLEQGASQTVRPAQLLFTRVVTVEGVSVMFGAAPYIVPPHWHTRIIDWRERVFRKRLMTREELADFDIEIRDLYFDIAAQILNPTPPQLRNTDGDPVALTTLTYTLTTTVADAFVKLAPLCTVHGEDHVDEIEHDASGAVTSAVMNWVKAGNRKLKDWDNTILGTLRLDAGRLVAEVNSTRRATRLRREITKRLGRAAVLTDTAVVDPSQLLGKGPRPPANQSVGSELEEEASAELRALQEEVTRRHWESWLDTRVPALGNRTPRQAVRSAGGRERLEALLAEFEQQDADGPLSVAVPVTEIRLALGLTEPRR